MCITQVKLTNLMKMKDLYLHLIPHFQRIQMYHIIPKNLVSNLFQFEIVHERMSFETMHGYKFSISLIIDFNKFQSKPFLTNCQNPKTFFTNYFTLDLSHKLVSFQTFLTNWLGSRPSSQKSLTSMTLAS
jgi:hypothetical protein